MSYILDALKKSQSEQVADGVALRVQQTAMRSSTSWIGIALGLILLGNAGLLLWVFVLDTDGESASFNATPVATERQTSGDQTVAEQHQAQPTASTPDPEPTLSAIPKSQPPPQPRPPIAKFMLQDLPSIEQSLYNGFTYTTHIYTDDPTLCAIVVDGQRLMAGDSFKGLGVVAITEAGVIFEENRRGQRRQIEVSVLQQWDK